MLSSRALLRAHRFLRAAALALLSLALTLDVAGVTRELPALWSAGGVLALAGLAAGGCAAGVGACMYLVYLPRGSTERRRGRRQIGLAASAVGLLALTVWVRGAVDVPPDPVLVWSYSLALTGFIASAWMARGLDRRIAAAGRPPRALSA